MKVISLLLFGFAMACSQSPSDVSYESAPEPMNEVNYSMDETEEMILESSQINNNTGGQDELEQKIIKTAHLDFETQELEKMYQNIMQLASQNKAIVQSDNSGKTYNRFFR